MPRLNIERQKALEPKRMQYAKEAIEARGYKITFESETLLNFTFRGKTVNYFPYSGWATGPTITDGRGLSRLLIQIKP